VRLNRGTAGPSKLPGSQKSLARGYTNQRIAQELVIAMSTAERHVANMLSMLGLRSRTEIAAWAVTHPLIGKADPLRHAHLCRRHSAVASTVATSLG
jgi:hypothetical protein